ncbi:hypothetical protein CapIbe_006956 [Capra ibex]
MGCAAHPPLSVHLQYHPGIGAEAEGRGLQNRPLSGTRTGRVGRRASAPGSRACCPRVHSPRAPSRERGQQGGGGGPRKVSGPDRLHEGRYPRVLRTYVPGRATSSPHRSPAAAPPPSQSPRGKLQPRRAPARPRPLPGPGALCRSH